MIRLITSRIATAARLTTTRFSFSYEHDRAKQVSMQMNQKVEAMKQTLAKTTPRSFSLLFLLASIPAFYFINQLIERQYHDPEFTNNSVRFYKYFYIYNLTFFACSLCLARFNFHSPSSMYTLPKTAVTSAVIPFLLSFLGLMLPETDSKHLVWPAAVTQLATMVVEGTMANKGMLPFWFYSHRHYIALFYFIMFLINYTAMNRLTKRRHSHAHQFVSLQKSS